LGYRKALTAAAVALSAMLGVAVDGSGAATAPTTSRLAGTASPKAAATPRVGAVGSTSRISFDVVLRLRNPSAASAFARAVATPTSKQYRHYLTAAQWEARFSPTAAAVAEVQAFLRRSGFTVSHVSADRMRVTASGTARQIETAFHTTLAYHLIAGKRLRIAERDLSVPSALSHVVLAVDGLNQVVARPASTVDGAGTRSSAATPGSTPPPPPGFRVAHPCASYYGQIVDTMLPPYGNGYPSPAPWAVCGYTPPQFRSAYHLTGANDGTGVTVAIVDAYLSPTLLSDAQTFAQRHDASHPLSASQFSINQPGGYNMQDLCGASGWYGEQTLDVEAVHGTAPGSNIVYTAGSNCLQTGLNEAVARIVDGHLADVITNSYGDPAGDVLDPPDVKLATDNILLMAAGTGISVLFSSGDFGDEYTTVGAAVPDYPASSPWATSVGGTSLQIGSGGQRTGEFGWSTARSLLCNSTAVSLGACTADQLNTWLPFDKALDGGSGGGTSYTYPQPFYQAGVVPNSLATVNSAFVGDQPMRVEPDIAAEADPATGMLVGETQTFPNGVFYDEYRIGGTSVASPLMAGVIARADEQAGTPLGFLNPALYSLYGNQNAFYDIGPAGKQDMSRADFANSLDESQGKLFWTRLVDYEGQEQFCESTGKCRTRDYALHATNGYDNMTGLGSPGEGFVRDLAKLGPFGG
jgi:subtilase family serine protease